MPPSLISSYFLLFLFYLQPHRTFLLSCLPLCSSLFHFKTACGFDVRSFSLQCCLHFWCLLSSTLRLPVLWYLLSSSSRLPVLWCLLSSRLFALRFCCLTEQLYSFPYSLRPVPAPFFLHYQGQRLSDLYLHL